ncbi:hypothetical protein X805_00730 [Sphaerotilus natans subsp. natans DSM 6575]|uniref:HTH lacI-type domain-containing protein n=1 Tax=Sphaerotilus natans subsp. natans DSM 6575 TaxID=1286631 RepID=A0A059KT93_9BURK|nr:LacI family DNA-binding transcriptional regulator [Sphaerotilus natans]KDB54343.1 hypothetical protein X805_00730 [Sphaerotilus natans subsp. natans DSM 6575]SIR07646.1 transcriptional regulator, LacI family [Sphaerotilus natans]
MSGFTPGRRATIADVARESGLSLSTVDRVLNARAPVRSDTAERVRQAAEALGFRASGVIGERVRSAVPRRTLGFLLQHSEPQLYRSLARCLTEAVDGAPGIKGQALVDYMDDISPDVVSARMEAMAERADAIAVVAADHPQVSATIERLRTRGVPVFSLLHDISAPARSGYACMDWRRVGRTTAWFMTRLTRRPGKLALFVGSHRFQGQELAEMSFRSYVREHGPRFEVLEALVTLENERMAGECLRDLLQREPDLVGFYVIGGGVEGVLQSLREERARTREWDEVIGACHELTAVSRQGLQEGHLHVVLSHPRPLLAQRLVERMLAVLAQPELGLQQVVIPIETWTPESV